MPHPTIRFFRLIQQILLLAFFLTISACSSLQKSPQHHKAIAVEKSSFQALPDWRSANHPNALSAFKNSCTKIVLLSNTTTLFDELPNISVADLQYACTQANQWQGNARLFFEAYFDVYTARANGSRDSFFTGYYESTLNASTTKKAALNAPIYAIPDDLITVNLSDFDQGWQGKKLWGRIDNKQLKPYWSREEIHNKNLPAEIIAWADRTDVFFLQIQGSGLLTLDSGVTLRVGFAGRNGLPYTAIGKPLIEQDELDAATISMQSIRAWLAQNPERAQSIMNLNQSYIFFRPLDSRGPIGAHGVPLTAHHSIAVDPEYWHYGLPLYVSAEHPNGHQTLNQLMITQDTGSAIKGPLRGDVFWGNGDYAAQMAGKMKSPGVTWVLLPKAQ